MKFKHRVRFRALSPSPSIAHASRMRHLPIAQDHKIIPQRRISKRIRHACSLLISGEVTTVKAAAERAKLSRTHLSRTLQEPHIRAFIEHEMRKNIATAQMRAGSVLAKLMDEGKSEHVRRDCAQYFNELAGFVVAKNAAPMINISNTMIAPGYVIDLSAAASPALPNAPSYGSNRVHTRDITDVSANGPADHQTSEQDR